MQTNPGTGLRRNGSSNGNAHLKSSTAAGRPYGSYPRISNSARLYPDAFTQKRETHHSDRVPRERLAMSRTLEIGDVADDYVHAPSAERGDSLPEHTVHGDFYPTARGRSSSSRRPAR